MAVNVKLGVDLSQFTSGIREGQNIMKGLNAEMKNAEAEFKATGNAEQMLAAKTKTLNSQIQIQKGIADQAAQALKAMTDAGINPTDAAYQKLYATMINATAGMNNAQAELNALSGSAQDAASSADQLTTSVQSIGKKISLDQAISGISRIKSGLEQAARYALELGKNLWNGIEDSAQRGDDVATAAMVLGMDIESYQRYQKVFDTFGEITVKDWRNAQSKIQKAIVNTTDEQFDIFAALGVGLRDVDGNTSSYYNKYVIGQAREWEDVFWDVGAKLRENVANGKISQDQADVYAQALFGKSWANLNTIFELGKEGFKALYDSQDVVSEESIKNLAELNDQLNTLKGDFNSLKDEVIGQLAPNLTDAAKALDGVLSNVMDYLKTEKGQQMLQDLGKAVGGLFDDLGKIDPEQVVSGFTGVIKSVTDGIQWLVDNAETVKGILETIVGAWALSNVAIAGLEITKLIQGIQGLSGAGAASAGAAAGASWGSAFASAVAAAAPWLIGLYTLVNPAATAGNNQDVLWSNGQLTQAGVEWWSQNQGAWDARMMAVGNRYGSLSTIVGDQAALDIMLNPTIGDEEVFKQLEEQLGLKPLDIPYQMVPETSAENIAEQVGPVALPVTLYFAGGGAGIGGGGGGMVDFYSAFLTPRGFANGIHSVPYDGMLARLHKGERVMPAREVQSRSYNSNLYVESMYMNNGTDAAGLASAMAAAQQRQMSGFGS